MRANLIKTNFTAGRFPPPDGASGYRTLCQRRKDCRERGVCDSWRGHASSRSRFAAKAKFGDQKARLIPYVFNRSQAYVLEFGNNYVRFYQNGAQIGSGSTPMR